MARSRHRAIASRQPSSWLPVGEPMGHSSALTGACRSLRAQPRCEGNPAPLAAPARREHYESSHGGKRRLHDITPDPAFGIDTPIHQKTLAQPRTEVEATAGKRQAAQPHTLRRWPARSSRSCTDSPGFGRDRTPSIGPREFEKPPELWRDRMRSVRLFARSKGVALAARAPEFSA
jgi:hypothetical protein